MRDGAAGGTSAPPGDRNDLHDAIASGLVSLIGSVHASMELIQSAAAGGTPLGYQETGTNVVILDDVTPRYLRVCAALNSCETHLDAALRFLLDTRTPQPDTAATGRVGRPARSVGCA